MASVKFVRCTQRQLDEIIQKEEKSINEVRTYLSGDGTLYLVSDDGMWVYSDDKKENVKIII